MLFSHPPGGTIDSDGALEPSVPITAGTAGKVLTSDGTTASWQPGGGGGSPDPIIMPGISVSGIYSVVVTTTLTLQKAGKTVTLMMPSISEAEGKGGGPEIDVGPFDLSAAGYTPSVNYGNTSISYPFVAEDDNPVAAFLVLDWSASAAATATITKADGSAFAGATGGYDTSSISWATDS